MKKILFLIYIICCISCKAAQHAGSADTSILPAAYRTDVYMPLFKGKRIGVFANQTSMIGGTHLVDSLIKSGIDVVKIFSPEHGFRGNAGAGEKTNDAKDDKTGLPIISLYGKKLKPSADDLRDVDILLFDIQDVGVRFYTYISSLQYFMEAAFENHKPLMLLDRPNPNGFYVDGPVLDKNYKSFVGMQPVPVVYGMTIGEYACMIAGQGWLNDDANKVYDYYKTAAENSVDTPFHFLVIKCANYNHKSLYKLPIKPSPNLADMGSIYCYPSTCFFEGTVISEGRGTDEPFRIFGHPSLPENLYAFMPAAREWAKEPKCLNQQCYGWHISGNEHDVLKELDGKIQLKYLIKAYKLFPDKKKFFLAPSSSNAQDYFFNKLAGNNELMQQIIDGKTEDEIRKSWQLALDAFKMIRKKYLLYDDF